MTAGGEFLVALDTTPPIPALIGSPDWSAGKHRTATQVHSVE